MKIPHRPSLNVLGALFAALLSTACTSKSTCATDSECSANQICAESACRAPRYPVIAEWASERATYEIEGENLLVSGRKITPAGKAVFVGSQPTLIELTSDGKFAVANEAAWGSNMQSDDPVAYYLRVIDLAKMEVIQKITPPNRLLWQGMYMTQTTETVVWATDGRGNKIHEFAMAVTGHLTHRRSITVAECYTTGIVVDPIANRAYTSCLTSSTFALVGSVKVVNLGDGAIEQSYRIDGAFSLLLTPDRKHVYVASIATEVNPQGGDKVTVIDTQTNLVVKEISVGLGPEGMVYSTDTNEIFVACNRTDDIYVIGDEKLAVNRVISLHNEPAPLKGLYPVGLALAAKKLYVTAAHENAIVIVDTADDEIEGMIPTGWYPNAVAVSPDGKSLIISNGRGVGDGPSNFPGPGFASPGRALRGSIGKVDLPGAGQLAKYTAQVEQNNDRQATYFDFTPGNDTPLPGPGASTGPSGKIKHVFFILKENFSYDAAYGDFERGDGNPEYTLWPEDIIPNQRKLAREYTLFDNFYCQTDSSLDGHAWAAAGIETDFMEKYNWNSEGFGTIAVSLTPGTKGESPFFMPHLLDQGISVLGYGGIENFGAGAYSDYKDYMVPNFHWNTQSDKTDLKRAQVFQEEFQRRLDSGDMPSFSWIFLGNNHAFGLAMGEPIPEYWVGENDLAVGMVVGAIAASPIWKDSLIFITEDDAQSGHDHVDKHRCPALAIGPWVKRGHTSSVVYTINNFHKTTELLLGSKPMHRLDRAAVGMYDMFTARPDTKPFEPVLRDVPRTLYDGSQKELIEESARMNWKVIDQNPNAGDFYWRYRKGTAPPRAAPFYQYRKTDEADD